jgi:hypothetical protein
MRRQPQCIHHHAALEFELTVGPGYSNFDMFEPMNYFIWVFGRSMMEPFNWNCLFKTRGGLEIIDAFLTAPIR